MDSPRDWPNWEAPEEVVGAPWWPLGATARTLAGTQAPGHRKGRSLSPIVSSAIITNRDTHSPEGHLLAWLWPKTQQRGVYGGRTRMAAGHRQGSGQQGTSGALMWVCRDPKKLAGEGGQQGCGAPCSHPMSPPKVKQASLSQRVLPSPPSCTSSWVPCGNIQSTGPPTSPQALLSPPAGLGAEDMDGPIPGQRASLVSKCQVGKVCAQFTPQPSLLLTDLRAPVSHCDMRSCSLEGPSQGLWPACVKPGCGKHQWC